MTITEMRNKRKKIIETMDGFLDTHKTKNGTLSGEDDKKPTKPWKMRSLNSRMKSIAWKDVKQSRLNLKSQSASQSWKIR